MEALRSVCLTVDSLDAAVSERLSVLEAQHARQRQVLAFLRSCREEKRAKEAAADAKLDCVVEEQVQEKSKPDASVTGSNGSLEEVLARARVMRQAKQQQQQQGSSSSAQDSKKESKAKSKSLLLSGKLNAALDLAKAQPKKGESPEAPQDRFTKTTPPPPPAPQSPERNRTSPMADLQAQLAILTNPAVSALALPSGGEEDGAPHRGAALTQSRELWAAQAGLLTRLRGVPSFPPSLCFFLVEEERLLAAGVRPATTAAAASAPPVNASPPTEPPHANLQPMLQQLQQQFDKVWKSKLERQGPAQLGAQDRVELLRMWYRLQKCLQVYAHVRGSPSALAAPATAPVNNVTTVGAGAEEERVAGLLGELIAPLPLLAPTPTPSKLQALASPDWKAQARRCVDDFHAALQSRVEFTAETAVGKVFLKSVLRGLRACVEAPEDAERWKDALRAYRAAHCLLLRQAQSATSCLFITKV